MALDRSPKTRPLLTRREAADHLNVGMRTLVRLIASGDIPIIKIRNSTRIRPDVLDEFLDAHEERRNPKRG